MKSIYKILFAILIAGFLFVAVPTHNVWAGQCTATVNNFDANPKTLAFNQPINLTASIRVTGFESDGSCKDRDGNKYTSLRVQFRGDGFIIDGGTVAIRSSDPGPYQVTKSFKPSDYNKRAGERFSMVALISTGGSVAYSLTQSSPVPIILTAGSYGQWACVADDGKYACSPGNLRDCSDVISISPSSVITRICQGKPCDDNDFNTPFIFISGPAHPSIGQYLGHPLEYYNEDERVVVSNEHVSNGAWVAEINVKIKQ